MFFFCNAQIMWVSARSLLLLMLIAPPPAWAQEAWPPAVQQALRTAGIPPSSAAGVVQPLEGGTALLRVNEAAPMNPASVMKLVTTFAGLELLGPAFRWNTTAYLGGPL